MQSTWAQILLVGVLRNKKLWLTLVLRPNTGGVAIASCELVWIHSLPHELDFSLRQPPTVLSNNLGVTYLSVNPIFHLTHDLKSKRQLAVRYARTDAQIADIFTKPLSASRFPLLRSKLTVLDGQSRLNGGVKDASAALTESRLS